MRKTILILISCFLALTTSAQLKSDTLVKTPDLKMNFVEEKTGAWMKFGVGLCFHAMSSLFIVEPYKSKSTFILMSFNGLLFDAMSIGDFINIRKSKKKKIL